MNAWTPAAPESVDRRALMRRVRRAVIKVGSAIVSNDRGELDLLWMEALAADMADLVAAGVEVMLVSSGAVAAGVGIIGDRRPHLRTRRTLQDKQALAALGQSRLIEGWRQCFLRHKIHVAQVLVTRGDLDDRHRYMNARITLERLVQWHVLPVINENDTTATEELRLGDNDELSAILARGVKADLLVMLTGAEGLMTADPRTNPDAEVVPYVSQIHPEGIESITVAPGRSGRGGIKGKLHAARLATEGGVLTAIANGRKPGVLRALLDAETSMGTLILPRTGPRLNPLRSFLMTEKGSATHRLVVNAGAIQALTERGSSLLPVGIVKVEGTFEAGEVVLVCDESGHPLAKGIATHSATDLRSIAGRRTPEVQQLLGATVEPEAVHRDLLVLLPAPAPGTPAPADPGATTGTLAAM